MRNNFSVFSILAFLWTCQFAKAESLDQNYSRIKAAGGLTALCQEDPSIDECRIGIGDWKPEMIKKIKAMSIFCIENCALDTFGFIQTSNGEREYPQVLTKDFDPSHPSKGFEFKLFPIAMNLHKYKGCSGCPHIKTFPIKARLILNEYSYINLPLIARGTFYLPKAFRKEAINCSINDCDLKIEADFVTNKTTRRISSKAVKAYVSMIKSLNYHKIN